MYLPTIENHIPPPEAGRYGRVIQGARKQGLPFPQIYHLFVWNPAAAKHLGNMMQEVMRGETSELSSGWKELIAAFTSARNHCVF